MNIHEETLEIARSLIHKDPSLKDWVVSKFPELKEVEDEMIRKEIIQSIQDNMCVIHKDKCIAWLEKQGEKIDAIENFDTEFEKQVSHLIASAINKEHEYNQSYVKWTANALLNYAKHELEKQVKQKTAWNEEDEQMLTKAISAVKYACFDSSSIILWLKSIKERMKGECISVTDEELAQAKKDAYNDALDKIEYHSGEPTFDDGWSAAIWYLKKKNTQPQNTWKPSGEQIKTLYDAIVYVEGCNSNFKGNGSVLEKLYNDLKKLREE